VGDAGPTVHPHEVSAGFRTGKNADRSFTTAWYGNLIPCLDSEAQKCEIERGLTATCDRDTHRPTANQKTAVWMQFQTVAASVGPSYLD
jgi:hypothetical protein